MAMERVGLRCPAPPTGLGERVAGLPSLYPNPADNGLTLDLASLAGGPITEVAILDLEGKAQTGFTFRQEGTGRLGFYHLEGLAAGSYLIQLRIDNQTHAFAFVKN
jgi:hypothetical protein